MQRVLITGITGYIGSRLAQALADCCAVYGLVRQPLNETYLPLELREKLTLLPYDGRGESVLVALEASRPDVVYHLAAHYTTAHDIRTIPQLLESNVSLGVYLMEAMGAVRCRRLVYATTVTTRCTGGPYQPLTLYAAAKQAFADLVEYYTGTGAVSAAAVALSDTYGPGDQRPKVLNLIKQAVLQKTALDLTSGRQIYDAVYIDDVAQGFILAAAALELSGAAHRFYQLSAVRPRSLRETAELMLEVNGLNFQANWGGRPDPDYMPDCPLRIFPAPPGWKPLLTLEEGLRRFWYSASQKEKIHLDNHHCRFCGHELKHTFADLGFAPLSNEYLTAEDLNRGQMTYPLKVQVCEHCFLVQAELYQRPEQIFGEYQYFSSYSESWLSHCKAYVDMIIPRLGLSRTSRVLEIACNDGYLLQYFLPYGIPVKGIEPAENVAESARAKGIEVECCFFGADMAREIADRDGLYDLVIGNNVLAHVPDISDFVEGLAMVLSPMGTITMEFPHLMKLMEQSQFDTIYHEHFHYLSLTTVQTIFQAHGLEIYDVEELPTHGGSLRIYAACLEYASKRMSSAIAELLVREAAFGLKNIQTYEGFAAQMQNVKLNALRLFTELKQKGKHIAAFGAAAKGNTFLNYCGIKSDMIDFVVDSNPHKQGLYLPGSLIPIVGKEALREKKPDYLLILPWNLTEEIAGAARFVREWGCQFITCIPKITILP